MLPGLFPIQPMIKVAWSLSYEMFCYLLLPVMVVLLRLNERTLRWRLMLFVSIAAALSAYTVLNGGPIRLIMFISGMVLFEVVRNTELRAPSSMGAIALILGLAGMLWPLPDPAGETFKVLLLFATFLVFGLACFRSPHAWLPAAFSWTPLRWLGNMSYSYYLLHGLVLKGGFMALSRLFPPTGDDPALHWLLLLPMMALTLIPSAALFLLVERPFSLAPAVGPAVPQVPGAASAESRS
jgi:exopolysaccharide production protein ExoZ